MVIVPGGPSQVREILIYSWQYFEMLPGAKALLQDFLGTENPKYSTRFKVAWPHFWITVKHSKMNVDFATKFLIF